MKRIIRINRQEPSSEEIAKYADFQKVMGKYQTHNTNFGNNAGKTINRNYIRLATYSGIVITALVMYFVLKPDVPPQDFVFAPHETTNTPSEQVVVDVMPEYFLFASEKGCNCQSRRGSRIIIPPQAFVDKNGETYSGEVSLHYREYMDVFDIMLAGIPMIYDSTHRYHFESGGMFSIYAYGDNDTLEIAEGKAIEVLLLSTDTTTDHRSYYLKPDNNWVFLEHNVLIMPDNIKTEKKETTSSALSDSQVTQKMEQEVENMKKNMPFEPRTHSSKGYRFTLDVLPEEFPELKAFKGMEFEIARGTAGWNTELYETRWDNISVGESKIKGHLSMTLTKNGKDRVLDIYPVYTGEEYEKALASYKAELSAHNSLIDRKLKDIAEREKAYNAFSKQAANDELAYNAEMLHKTQTRNTATEAFRGFTVRSTGVFNCDKPLSVPQGTSVFAHFSDQSGNNLKISPVYLVEVGRNALYTFAANRNEKISYNPKKNNVLWGLTHDGKLAYARKEQLPALHESVKNHNFKMLVVEEPITDADKLRSLVLGEK